jgi:hypothetical protein
MQLGGDKVLTAHSYKIMIFNEHIEYLFIQENDNKKKKKKKKKKNKYITFPSHSISSFHFFSFFNFKK